MADPTKTPRTENLYNIKRGKGEEKWWPHEFSVLPRPEGPIYGPSRTLPQWLLELYHGFGLNCLFMFVSSKVRVGFGLV